MIHPVSSRARAYARSRTELFMEYQCTIERVGKGTYDEETLVWTPGNRTILYDGPCRLWAVSGGSEIVVSDTEISMQNTMLSIPWDEAAIIKRHDEAEIYAAPDDSQVVGLRFEIMSIEKAGELRATRRFQVNLLQDQR